MDNYYDDCIQEIEAYINKGEMSLALALVQKELAMPYVPEPYFSKFSEYLNDIVVDNKPRSQFFDSLEEIEGALRGNASLQQKGLLSLERMNLRAAQEWLSDVLLNHSIHDGIKKQILLFMLEQEIQGTYEIFLDQEVIGIDVGSLKHPVDSSAYQTCHQELRDILESHNPSLLLLCIGELDYAALERFPHDLKRIEAQSIIDRVNSYLQ